MARFKKMKKSRKAPSSRGGNVPDTKASHFSMKQEARNTEGRNFWRSNVQLRHKAVQFVSAGSLEPTREPDHPIEDAPTESESFMADKRLESGADNTQESELDIGHTEHSTPTRSMLPMRQRRDTPEDSSEDEVIFRGRRRGQDSRPYNCTESTIDNGDLPKEEFDEEASPLVRIPAELAVSSPGGAPPTVPRESSADWIPLNDDRETKYLWASEGDDDILADYIAHMDDNATSSSDEQQDMVEDPSTIAEQSSRYPEINGTHDLDSDDHDFLSTEILETETDYPFSGLSNPAPLKTDTNVFASATAFADALELDPYYGLDIMDYSRASLRKEKKKHRNIGFGSYDSELEDEMVAAWNNDRLKKKWKKREREELRAQGLLGRRKDDPDLKVKYANGIDIDHLKFELQSFLLSPKNSLSLPPMTKHRRMLIHDLAHALRLTSQSRGKGSSRFPVLSKTSRTPKYTKSTISQVERVFAKERFSPRALKSWDHTSGRPVKAKRGAGNASYMDGDVVGASAPEIGAGNKGRAMLEKMGWSTGTALGATNNKGILLPVAHVVKNSKAGLG